MREKTAITIRIATLVAVSSVTALAPLAARAGEVLEFSGRGRGGLFPGFPVIVSSFPLVTIAESAIRLIAGVFALYAATMIFYGIILRHHNCGNVDKCKLAHGVYRTGLHGFIVAMTVASFGNRLVTMTLSLIGLA
jgi:hypothetical protein